MQNGRTLDWVQNHTLTQQSLNWFASYTAPTTNINTKNLALVIPEE